MHCGKPTEAVWSHLKLSLANLAKRNISELTAPAQLKIVSLRYRKSLTKTLYRPMLPLTCIGQEYLYWQSKAMPERYQLRGMAATDV